MNFLKLISNLLTSVRGVVDKEVTTKEEKQRIHDELNKIELNALSEALDYEKTQLKEQASIMPAEANCHSWLQRNWRPITMLVFLALVVFDAFGWLPFRLDGEAWTLLQIGLGGYVVGRSVEKVAPVIRDSLRK